MKIINSATVITDAQNGVLRLHAAPGFTGSSTITVTADDGHGNTSQQQFNVNVVPDTINDPAFLGPVSNVTTTQGTPVTLNVQGYDLEDDQLTFVVKDPATFNTDTATGSATGQDWTNAFTNLQEALSVVVPGDAIWVATGQYRPTSGTNRTISFQLRNGMDLYGGFAGTETSIGERDLMANITVLNGDIGEPGSSADNSHRVVTASNINTTIVLDGFRIMNGYSASDSSYDGAGLNVQHALGGNLTVRNCTFVNNYNGGYGGAMYMAAADVTIERCSFVSNSAGTGVDAVK